MVKIFVGNLSPSTTQEELTSLFSQFGKVKECGVLKNFGFVHMDSKQEADEAILKLHHYELNGQAMNVELSKGKSRGSTKLHVSNIYSGCTNQELRSKFEVYGSVVECDIVKDYAFVHMERMEHAMEAINALDNSEFQGMLMKVQLSTSRLRTAPGMGDQTGCYVCGEQGHWSRDCGRGQNGSYGGGMGGYPGSRGPPRGGADYRMGLGAPPGREYQAESFIPPITRRLNYDEYGVSAYSQYASRPQAAYQERPTTYDSYGSMDLYEKYRAQASAYQTRPDAIPQAPPSFSRVPFTTPAVSTYSPAPMAAPTPSASAYFSRERSPIRRVVSGSEGYSYEQSRVTPVSRSSTTYTAPRPREGYTERVRYTY